MSDPVNSPAHYTAGGIEAIDYIRAKLGPDGFRAYCLGNVLKYVIRLRQGLGLCWEPPSTDGCLCHVLRIGFRPKRLPIKVFNA